MTDSSKLEPKDPSIIIIGSGFSGICAAIELKKAGFESIRILEKSDRLGGTWRDNTYPGAACDVPSHLYSFSFEPNPNWSRMFAGHEEILHYLNHCADKYDIRRYIRFNVSVESAHFNERQGVWLIQSSTGEIYEAALLISGTGGLSRPARPSIPGLERFQGNMFHSAQWDHSVSLKDKKVAVIGTGASAIQIIPNIVDQVSELKVFQRSPPWIMPKPDRCMTDKEKTRFKKFPLLQKILRLRIYLFMEYNAIGFVINQKYLGIAKIIALNHIKRKVKDFRLRDICTPRYNIGCKRILLSNDYYPAIQKDNVSIITDSIKEIKSEGIVASDAVSGADKLHEFDIIILATGFHAAEAKTSFDVKGLHGLDLYETWKPGAEAYKGTTITNFPNLFLIVGPNTGLGHTSMIIMIESQVGYIVSALKTLRKKQLKYLYPKLSVQNSYNDMLQKRLKTTVWQSGCLSWYQTRTGKNTTLWPGFTFEFRARLSRFDLSNYIQAKSRRQGRVNHAAEKTSTN